MSDEIISIAVDETQFTRGAAALERDLNKVHASLKDLNQLIEVFDRHGQLMEVRFKGITQAGEKFAGTVDELDKLFPTINNEIKRTTELTSRYEQAQLDAAAATKKLIAAEREASRELEANLRQRIADQKRAEREAKTEIEANLKQKIKEGQDAERQITREVEANIRERLAEQKQADREAKIEIEANLREQLRIQRETIRERLRLEKQAEREIKVEREANLKEMLRQAAEQRAAIAQILNAPSTRVGGAPTSNEAELDRIRILQLRENIQGRLNAQVAQEVALERKKSDVIQEQVRIQIRQLTHNEQQIENARISGLRNAILARSNQELGQSFDAVGKAGAKSGQEVLLSWHSVARLFAVQIIHQALAAIRLEMIRATQTSLEYANVLAQIRTISDDTTESTADWNRALLEVGQNLPFKQVDIARAAYQALSDQIIHTSGDLDFLTQATQLAILGVSDLETAVDVTSSTMNAFGLSMLRQHQISADLFRTVDLGRSTLDEIAENLGRVSISSAKLGVSFREQQAALAALTIQGVRDDVAKTLLINVYNKLIRPSERMNEIFKEWGVSSGQAAISAFGLLGVLSKFNDVATRSGDELAEFGEIFQEIRATTGGLGLDFAKLSSTIDQYTNSTAKFDERLKEFQSSTANRLKTEFANVDRLFLRLGDSVNRGIIGIADTFGGLDEALKLVARGVIDLGAVFIAIQSGKGLLGLISLVKFLNLELGKINSGAKTVGAALAGMWGPIVGLGVIALTELISYQLRWRERIQETIDEALKEWNKYYDEIDKKSQKSLEDWLNDVDATSRNVRGSIALVITEIRRMNDTLDVDLKQSFIELQDIARDFAITTTDALDVQIGAIKDNLQEAERLMREASANIERDAKRLQDLDEDVAIRQARRRNRNKDPQALARDLEFNVGTEDALDEALKINERIRDDNQADAADRAQAASEVLRLEDEITARKVAQANALAAEIKANEQIEKDQKAEIARLEKIQKQQEAVRDSFKQATDKFLDFDIENTRKVAEEKNTIDPAADVKAQIENELKIRQSTLDQFNDVSSRFSVTARAAGADPFEILKIEKEIEKRRQEIIKDSEAEILRIRTDALQGQLNQGQEAIDAEFTKAQNAKAEAMNALKEAQSQSTKDLANIRGFLDQIGPNISGASGGFGGFGGVGGGNSEFINGADNVRRLRQDKERKALIQDTVKAEALEQELAKQRGEGIPDEVKYNEILKQRNELLTSIADRLQNKGLIGTGSGNDFGAGETGDQIADRIRESVADITAVFEKEEQALQALADVEESFNVLNERLKELGLDRKAEIATNRNSTWLENLTGATRDNIDALHDLRDEIVKRSGDLPPARPQRPEEEFPAHAMGGLVGGVPGVDQNLAWVSRGEYIVNSTAARENMPILTAINSGAANFNRGGSVQNNINFNGGFNFTGSPSEQAMVDRVWREIQRRITRGVASVGRN